MLVKHCECDALLPWGWWRGHHEAVLDILQPVPKHHPPVSHPQNTQLTTTNYTPIYTLNTTSELCPDKCSLITDHCLLFTDHCWMFTDQYWVFSDQYWVFSDHCWVFTDQCSVFPASNDHVCAGCAVTPTQGAQRWRTGPEETRNTGGSVV